MAVMGRERVVKVVGGHSDESRWTPTVRGLQLAEETRMLEIESKRRLKLLTPECPTHKITGKYLRTDGTFQKSIPIFSCPEGHEFNIPD